MKKNIENIKYIIIKILLLIITGILAIITPKEEINYFHLAVYFGMSIYGIIQILIFLRRKSFSYFNLFFVIINFLMSLLTILLPNIYIKILPSIIGIYILIIGLARLLTIFIYQKIPESKINILINSIIHFIFSFILIFNSSNNLKTITTIIGIYLILLGISYIPKGSHHKNNIKIVQIPTIFQSLKPYNDFIKIDFEHYNNESNDIEVDVEVLIHVRKNRRGVFGHADFIYNGFVYSYGNYDTNSFKLWDAIGDGLLVKADKEQYIKYCKSYGKSLFSFGIKLNNEEKKQLDERFQKIMDNTYIFEKNKVAKNSYIDKLSQNANTIFYKFKDGYYKNYFFLNYNCVKFIEEVISLDVLDFTSIKTPGTLYTHLEEQYQEENSKIVRKIIY